MVTCNMTNIVAMYSCQYPCGVDKFFFGEGGELLISSHITDR